ncbi:carbohydrate kinase family protein [Frateuria aurantia]|uniref:Sugar kinase, ribokinase n=1 Tax=Frateuria aurantia (strain ATCC 33424 / DSM 6220 / KCTC 2777 / LMG 1558 / NBRC 3245 / NCIMB 13370) TaxID=767434 RepID=H8L598_FRAAD|nr:carbohydrate kinase family protein [Frateuria aurantia]AFC85055.1 sugar kinase, ribokinase [Frateuria aurantia DSM 6220]
MPAVICGSLAYDTIMVFQDQFKNHILPDQVHILNVSFLVPGMRREFGGCAGNIAYNLKLLGDEPIVVAAVGQDFAPYRAHLVKHGIRLDHVREYPEQFTPQCFITTDLDNNQITAFHPGAMSSAHEISVSDIEDCELAIVAPDSREAMLRHVDDFFADGTPFIFDPGQAMPLFNGEEFQAMIEKATYVIVNDYESQLLQTRTGWSAETIAGKVKAYIVTQGPRGSVIHADGEVIAIPPAREHKVVDPTGCGDAYRAGLIHGITHGRDWATTGRMASLMGALKVGHPGTQNQHFDFASFAAEFEDQFGYALD